MYVVFSGRAVRRVLVLLNMKAPPAQLREESFRGPTPLKTASVIAVMPMESLLILRRQVGKHRQKAAEVRQDDMYDNLASRFDEGRFGNYHRPFYQKYTTRRFWSRVTVSRPDHSLIMICGEDDEDASDKNTDAIGLELEQGQRSRSVPQWVPTTDLQKMNNYNLPKCKKKT